MNITKKQKVVLACIGLLLFITPHLFAQEIPVEILKQLTFSKPDSVLLLAKQNLKNDLSKEDRSTYLLLAAISLRNKGLFREGLNYGDSVLSLEITKDIGFANQNNGVCYRFLGKYDSAISCNIKALEIFESLSMLREKAIVYNSLGVVNMKVENYEEALKNYSESLVISEGLADQDNISDVVNNMAIVYANQGDLVKSEEFFRKGLMIELTRENLKGISAGYNNLGAIKYYQKMLDSAIFYFAKSLQVDKIIGDKQGIPEVMTNIAEVAKANNDLLLAETYLDSAISMSKEVQSLNGLKNAYLNLAGVYQLKNQYQKAFEFLELSHAYSDSLISKDKNKVILELQEKYETAKKEQTIALQTAEIDSQAAELKVTRVLSIGLVVLVILLLVIGVQQRKYMLNKRDKLIAEEKARVKDSQIEAAINTQEEERKRFARDLHDGFGQLISVLNLNLSSLESAPEKRQEVYENSTVVLDQMYKELKSICFNLMPETLIKNGLKDAIDEFASRINIAGKIQIETNFFGIEERLTDLQEISLYRITQEWVNNVIKYADAKNITIQLTKDEEELNLLIEDDGMGFDKALLTQGTGNGWKNLNSRANLIKGELELDTLQGRRGSTIIVVAPELVVKQNTVITV